MSVITENCPRCHADMADEPGGGALSRVDNKTYICSDCGQSEAIFNFVRPGEPLPPLNEVINSRFRVVGEDEIAQALREEQ